MGQERLSGLSLISIERGVACNCDYEDQTEILLI